MSILPGYLNLYKTGILEKRAQELKNILLSCSLCPRECKVNRFENEGFCKSGIKPKISSYNIHNGEEPPISGINGSGTIFLTGCTLRCVFCQNYPISQLYNGQEYEEKDLADMMLDLQSKGCHNINFVTPTHFVPQIVSSLVIAVKKGFNIPIVYNTNGYDSLGTIKLLSGIVDIYLPDIKYWDDSIAFKLSYAKNYCESAKQAIYEMYCQIGNLILNKDGIGIRGLIIRHLVLPEGLSGSKEILHFIANNISRKTYISLMSQYFPAYHAGEISEIKRTITKTEYEEVLDIIRREKLNNGWIQPL
ncbi:radical SAM protein [Candidatus Poribacteria bacterium]|nr:radical SAM protein [Candidatus Poribacteria bacterium]